MDYDRDQFLHSLLNYQQVCGAMRTHLGGLAGFNVAVSSSFGSFP